MTEPRAFNGFHNYIKYLLELVLENKKLFYVKCGLNNNNGS